MNLDLKGFRSEHMTVKLRCPSEDHLDEVSEKADVSTFLFVGRMKEAKRPDHALEAFESIEAELPEASLHMVGDGYMLEDLKARANGGVEFHGHVSEDEKLMKRSHMLLVPSVREGWGLVVTEANAMGTPAVGYDVPGLRDSIEEGITGALTSQDPKHLAAQTLDIHRNGIDGYSEAALQESHRFDWNDTCQTVENRLIEVVT